MQPDAYQLGLFASGRYLSLRGRPLGIWVCGSSISRSVTHGAGRETEQNGNTIPVSSKSFSPSDAVHKLILHKACNSSIVWLPNYFSLTNVVFITGVIKRLNFA